MPIDLNFQGIKLPEGISREMVRAAAKKYLIVQKLDRQYGKDTWGVKEIVAYLVDPETVAKRNSNRNKGYLRTVEGRLKEYTDSFENITPNDLAMFENMVGIEMRMDTVRA